MHGTLFFAAVVPRLRVNQICYHSVFATAVFFIRQVSFSVACAAPGIRELVRLGDTGDEQPLALQQNGFTPKQISAPEAVPGGPGKSQP